MRRVGPGPAKYALPSTIGFKDLDIRKRHAPSYPIGERIPVKTVGVGPGPAQYHPGECTRYGKEHQSGYIGEKIKINAVNRNPAPNAYKLPESMGTDRVNVYKKRSPAYQIGNKIPNKFVSITPGPNVYSLPQMVGPDGGKVYKRHAPSYTIGNKLNALSKSSTPGPDAYFPSLENWQKIHTTILPRRPLKAGNSIPAPNEYDLQMYKPGRSVPAYTIRKKYAEWIEPLIVEGDN